MRISEIKTRLSEVDRECFEKYDYYPQLRELFEMVLAKNPGGESAPASTMNSNNNNSNIENSNSGTNLDSTAIGKLKVALDNVDEISQEDVDKLAELVIDCKGTSGQAIGDVYDEMKNESYHWLNENLSSEECKEIAEELCSIYDILDPYDFMDNFSEIDMFESQIANDLSKGDFSVIESLEEFIDEIGDSYDYDDNFTEERKALEKARDIIDKLKSVRMNESLLMEAEYADYEKEFDERETEEDRRRKAEEEKKRIKREKEQNAYSKKQGVYNKIENAEDEYQEEENPRKRKMSDKELERQRQLIEFNIRAKDLAIKYCERQLKLFREAIKNFYKNDKDFYNTDKEREILDRILKVGFKIGPNGETVSLDEYKEELKNSIDEKKRAFINTMIGYDLLSEKVNPEIMLNAKRFFDSSPTHWTKVNWDIFDSFLQSGEYFPATMIALAYYLGNHLTEKELGIICNIPMEKKPTDWSDEEANTAFKLLYIFIGNTRGNLSPYETVFMNYCRQKVKSLPTVQSDIKPAQWSDYGDYYILRFNSDQVEQNVALITGRNADGTRMSDEQKRKLKNDMRQQLINLATGQAQKDLNDEYEEYETVDKRTGKTVNKVRRKQAEADEEENDNKGNKGMNSSYTRDSSGKTVLESLKILRELEEEFDPYNDNKILTEEDIDFEEDVDFSVVKTMPEDSIIECATAVMDAYQSANKWLDTVKEAVYHDMSCVFFSSFIHKLAHTMPERFDKFGDILHTANIRIPYPATNYIPNEPTNIDEVFDSIFMVMDNIKIALNDFIRCTDEQNHGLSCAAEGLLNDIESEYPMLYRFRHEWEQCGGDTIQFDKYVNQYVNHKDDLVESWEDDEDEFDDEFDDEDEFDNDKIKVDISQFNDPFLDAVFGIEDK